MTGRAGALAAAGFIVALGAAGAALYAQDFFGGRRESFAGVSENVEYDGRVTFARVRFATGFGRACAGRRGSNGEPPWAHDYPTADVHMMKIVNELTSVAPRFDGSNVFTLDDPALANYPIAYVSEPGCWSPSDAEAAGLRNYLLKGGFVIFDDFRGADWYNLQEQMRRVLPEGRFVQLDVTAPIFNSFFEIRSLDFGFYPDGPPAYYGMFEDNDPKKRLLAIAGNNQDLGEYWEFSDTGWIPIDLSNEAYKFGVNYFIYALTH